MTYIPRVRPGVDAELQRDLRGAYERINALQAQLQQELQRVRQLAQSYDFARIRRELSAGGQAPINVQGLLGILAQPQVAGATVVSALPGPDDPLSQDGSLVSFSGQLYVYDESAQTWNSATGSVSSVDADGGVTGYDFTGGPITSSGTLTMAVVNAATARGAIGAAEAQAIAGATIPLAKITGGGTDGSITVNAEGVVTAYTAPT